MRSCEANKRDILYANRTGITDNGFGEYYPTYSKKARCRVSYSYVNADVGVLPDGQTSDCDIKMVSYIDYGWDINTVFWIENLKSDEHDYVMSAPPQPSVNGTLYKLKRRVDI